MLLMHVCASSPPALPAPSILLLACPADGCPAVSGCCCGRCSCCSPEPGQPSPAGENTLYEGWLWPACSLSFKQPSASGEQASFDTQCPSLEGVPPYTFFFVGYLFLGCWPDGLLACLVSSFSPLCMVTQQHPALTSSQLCGFPVYIYHWLVGWHGSTFNWSCICHLNYCSPSAADDDGAGGPTAATAGDYPLFRSAASECCSVCLYFALSLCVLSNCLCAS